MRPLVGLAFCEVQAIRRACRDVSSHDANERQQELMTLARWSDQEIGELELPMPVPATRHDGLVVWPGSLGTLLFWPPPSSALAKIAFSGKLKTTTVELRKALKKEWGKLHEPLQSGNRKFANVTYPRISRCFLAGFCLHTPEGRRLDAFVAELQRALRLAFAPGQVARDSYDTNSLVLEFCLTKRRQRPRSFFFTSATAI